MQNDYKLQKYWFHWRWNNAAEKCSTELGSRLCLLFSRWKVSIKILVRRLHFDLWVAWAFDIEPLILWLAKVFQENTICFSCSLFAYWRPHVDHPCLLASATFDIRFAWIPNRERKKWKMFIRGHEGDISQAGTNARKPTQEIKDPQFHIHCWIEPSSGRKTGGNYTDKKPNGNY